MMWHLQRKYLQKKMSSCHQKEPYSSKQRKRDESLDEEDIHLAELQKRIRVKNIMDEQQYKDEQGAGEDCRIRTVSQNNMNTVIKTDISSDSQTVPFLRRYGNCEINAKVGLGSNPNHKPRKPIPKPRKNLAIREQKHVQNFLAKMTNVIFCHNKLS